MPQSPNRSNRPRPCICGNTPERSHHRPPHGAFGIRYIPFGARPSSATVQTPAWQTPANKLRPRLNPFQSEFPRTKIQSQPPSLRHVMACRIFPGRTVIDIGDTARRCMHACMNHLGSRYAIHRDIDTARLENGIDCTVDMEIGTDFRTRRRVPSGRAPDVRYSGSRPDHPKEGIDRESGRGVDQNHIPRRMQHFICIPAHTIRMSIVRTGISLRLHSQDEKISALVHHSLTTGVPGERSRPDQPARLRPSDPPGTR